MIARCNVLEPGSAAIGGLRPPGVAPHARTQPFPAPPPTLVISGLIGPASMDPDGQGEARSFSLEEFGRLGTIRQAIAINGYGIEIPVAEAVESGAFLATRLDRRPIRTSDFGTVSIIHPWSQRPKLDAPVFRRRAIRQLAQIEVR